MAISDFHRWCEHYGYDPASEEAARDYREAQEAYAALMAVAHRKEAGNDQCADQLELGARLPTYRAAYKVD